MRFLWVYFCTSNWFKKMSLLIIWKIKENGRLCLILPPIISFVEHCTQLHPQQTSVRAETWMKNDARICCKNEKISFKLQQPGFLLPNMQSVVTDSIKAVGIHQYLTETHTHTRINVHNNASEPTPCLSLSTDIKLASESSRFPRDLEQVRSE